VADTNAGIAFDTITVQKIRIARAFIDALVPPTVAEATAVDTSVATECADTSSVSGTVLAKVTRQEWWDVYFTPERKKQLSREYRNVTAAGIGVAKLMAADPSIDSGAYAPRHIENLLRRARVFPPERR
jgi:hypothetical protein